MNTATAPEAEATGAVESLQPTRLEERSRVQARLQRLHRVGSEDAVGRDTQVLLQGGVAALAEEAVSGDAQLLLEHFGVGVVDPRLAGLRGSDRGLKRLRGGCTPVTVDGE